MGSKAAKGLWRQVCCSDDTQQTANSHDQRAYVADIPSPTPGQRDTTHQWMSQPCSECIAIDARTTNQTLGALSKICCSYHVATLEDALTRRYWCTRLGCPYLGRRPRCMISMFDIYRANRQYMRDVPPDDVAHARAAITIIERLPLLSLAHPTLRHAAILDYMRSTAGYSPIRTFVAQTFSPPNEEAITQHSRAIEHATRRISDAITSYIDKHFEHSCECGVADFRLLVQGPHV
jgi:hypothetical protein